MALLLHRYNAKWTDPVSTPRLPLLSGIHAFGVRTASHLIHGVARFWLAKQSRLEVDIGSDIHLYLMLQQVGWAFYAPWSSIQYMGVDHGCLDVLMTQQFLDRANVISTFQ